jgi:hypothetical protein
VGNLVSYLSQRFRCAEPPIQRGQILNEPGISPLDRLREDVDDTQRELIDAAPRDISLLQPVGTTLFPIVLTGKTFEIFQICLSRESLFA